MKILITSLLEHLTVTGDGGGQDRCGDGSVLSQTLLFYSCFTLEQCLPIDPWLKFEIKS